jgi:hypothetical protein
MVSVPAFSAVDCELELRLSQTKDLRTSTKTGWLRIGMMIWEGRTYGLKVKLNAPDAWQQREKDNQNNNFLPYLTRLAT